LSSDGHPQSGDSSEFRRPRKLLIDIDPVCELVGKNLRGQEITRLAAEMISYGFPFEKPVRQIDGSDVVARVGVSRRRDRRLHAILTVRVELRCARKPSDRDKTIPTRPLRDPFA
jgi:hypothetical protein